MERASVCPCLRGWVDGGQHFQLHPVQKLGHEAVHMQWSVGDAPGCMPSGVFSGGFKRALVARQGDSRQPMSGGGTL
jgi:hypothetical protein